MKKSFWQKNIELLNAKETPDNCSEKAGSQFMLLTLFFGLTVFIVIFFSISIKMIFEL